MSDQITDEGQAPSSTPTPSDVAPKPQETADKAPAQAVSDPTEKEPSGASNPWDNPDSARAEIERLRRENAKDRTNAKESARTALATEIGKALGLVEDEPADPAQLTEQLTQQKLAARSAQVELAVFKAAGAAGGDPAALLDSSSFLAKAYELDPSDPAAMTAAIQEAVSSNPRLGAAAASRTPAPNPAQGSSGSGTGAPQILDQAELDRMSPAEIIKARDDGRLNRLLGIS